MILNTKVNINKTFVNNVFYFYISLHENFSTELESITSNQSVSQFLNSNNAESQYIKNILMKSSIFQQNM